MDEAAFDGIAADYDADFTASTLGTRMRAAVWRRLDAAFAAPGHVLELGCGTGEDAVHMARRGLEVTAFDRAAEMVKEARHKVEKHDLGERVHLRQCAIEDWAADPSAVGGPFDFALSNFGALNCVVDLLPVATGLARVMRPGGRAVFVVMGPVVPWEWLWYLAHGSPGRAFRRLRPGGVEWRGLRVRYPSIGALKRAFRPSFRVRSTVAVGTLLPPSYVEDWAARRPRLIARLDRWERRLEAWPPFPRLADHYLIELERTV